VLKVIKKAFAGLLVVLCSIPVGLLVAEGIVRAFNFDWRYIKRLLYYQMVDTEVFQPDPNPNLFYRLKPKAHMKNTGNFGSYAVHINSLGFRGVERSAEKPEGVFRIICLGGSNVYGQHLNDDETWPAQLEAELNSTSPGRYEVWNMGACAYVGCQMAVLAREAAERYDPDMIIFALSNQASPAFLRDSDVSYYFRKYPRLWKVLVQEGSISFIPRLSYETKIALMRSSSLFRLSALALAELAGSEIGWYGPEASHHWESLNIKSIRGFIDDYGDRMSICVFLCPAVRHEEYESYYEGLDIPVFRLSADGLPDEYREIHPPPYVMRWYAEELAEWLLSSSLLEPKGEVSARDAQRASDESR